MAKVTVSGMTETALSFERLAEMPESVRKLRDCVIQFIHELQAS